MFTGNPMPATARETTTTPFSFISAIIRSLHTLIIAVIEFLVKKSVELLLDSKANTSITDNEGWSAGDVRGVNKAPSHGAPVDHRGVYDTTPLHRAAFPGKDDVVSALVDEEADLKAKDRWGRTALHEASEGLSSSR